MGNDGRRKMQGDGDGGMRVALATANLQLPGKQFVITQAEVTQPGNEFTLFTYAASGASTNTIPIHQSLGSIPLPFALRRRTYPLTTKSLERDIERWSPDLVHLHFMALGGFAARTAERLGVPLVCTVHAVERHLQLAGNSRRDRRLRDEALAVKESATEFWAVSGFIGEWLAAQGIERSRIRTHYLGVDTTYWTTQSSAVDRRASQRVLFVGHLSVLKGALDLVSFSNHLLPHYPHRLDVVGTGPLKDEIAVASQNSPHITLHGLVSRDHVRALLERSTCLVLPTRAHRGVAEAAPTVVMEAQAMGVPVVAYDVGGTREMMAGEQLVIPEDDTDALRDGIVRILSASDVEYGVLSAQATQFIRRHRSAHSNAIQANQRYIKLISGGSSSAGNAGE